MDLSASSFSGFPVFWAYHIQLFFMTLSLMYCVQTNASRSYGRIIQACWTSKSSPNTCADITLTRLPSLSDGFGILSGFWIVCVTPIMPSAAHRRHTLRRMWCNFLSGTLFLGFQPSNSIWMLWIRLRMTQPTVYCQESSLEFNHRIG